MKTIAILNLKGGVGKTATTINAAAILAGDYQKRVAVIDADSQANLTEFLEGDPAHGNGSLSKVLRFDPEEAPLSPAEFVQTSFQPSNLIRVDILPGDDQLMDLDLSSVRLKTANAEILAKWSRSLLYSKRYDYCLIDCPPAFNAASCAALLAATEVVIPIKVDAFSLRGMANLMRQISNMRQINPSLLVAGLLPTMVYRSDTIEKASEALKTSGLRVFSPIRRTPKVDDMTFAQRPLIESSPKSSACKDYRRFVKELIGGENNG